MGKVFADVAFLNHPLRNSGVEEPPPRLAAPDKSTREETIGEPAHKKAIEELVREFGNPSPNGRPGDLEIFDLAAMEE